MARDKSNPDKEALNQRRKQFKRIMAALWVMIVAVVSADLAWELARSS